VQQLIIEHPVLLEQDADDVVDKTVALGQRLGIKQHKDVLTLWMRSSFMLLNLSRERLDAQLQKLAAAAGLSVTEVGLVASQRPGILYEKRAHEGFLKVRLVVLVSMQANLFNA
jgi:hypothetical protein